MGFIKKVWKNRISEYPTRRTLTKEDGSTELVTVSRSEGTVSQEGDAFSADNLNDLETRVDDAFTEVNSNLSHYNPDTDSLDIYYNGELVGSLYLGFKEIIITLNDGSVSWVMVKEINGLPTGQYTFTVTANRTDSGSHDSKNAVGLSTTLTDSPADFSIENSNRQLEYTKTYNITSVNDKIYVYIYNANASYKYSGKVLITKNT